MTGNMAMEVLKIIHRNPRITPTMIHDKMKKATTFSVIEFALRTLRETRQVKTISRGVYEITKKGVETLCNSEAET